MKATGLLNTASYATVRIPDHCTALSIDSCVHEVEQISIVWIVVATRSSEIADRASLHWIIRRSISRSPGHTTIKRRGDVEMPRRALVVGRLIRVVTDHGRSKEGIRRAIVVARDDFRER